MVVVPLWVPDAKLLVQVMAPVKSAVLLPFVAFMVDVPELSVKHFIAVIVRVLPLVFRHVVCK
jgi:hypothetical protein